MLWTKPAANAKKLFFPVSTELSYKFLYLQAHFKQIFHNVMKSLWEKFQQECFF